MAICIVKRKLSRIVWHVHVYVDGNETRMDMLTMPAQGCLWLLQRSTMTTYVLITKRNQPSYSIHVMYVY